MEAALLHCEKFLWSFAFVIYGMIGSLIAGHYLFYWIFSHSWLAIKEPFWFMNCTYTIVKCNFQKRCTLLKTFHLCFGSVVLVLFIVLHWIQVYWIGDSVELVLYSIKKKGCRYSISVYCGNSHLQKFHLYMNKFLFEMTVVSDWSFNFDA